jgi:hypothetical protein
LLVLISRTIPDLPACTPPVTLQRAASFTLDEVVDLLFRALDALRIMPGIINQVGLLRT